MDFEKFFAHLTASNRLAAENGFRFQVVSDLEGFAEAISDPLSNAPRVCLSDTSEGAISIDNAPSVRHIKTVFLYMPIDITADWMQQRQEAFALLRELFRQFATVLIRESTRLANGGVFIDPQIRFTEIDRYFYTGGACAYFQIAVDTPSDLILRPEHWLQDPLKENE